jgi:hypothetical protein
VACSEYEGEERGMQGFGGGNLRERDHLQYPDVDGSIIFRLIFRKWDVEVELDLAGSAYGQVVGTCE